MTGTNEVTQPGRGRWRRRIYAYGVLCARLMLLVVTVFVLFATSLTHFVGVLVCACLVLGGVSSSVSAFRRSWKETTVPVCGCVCRHRDCRDQLVEVTR